MKQMYPVLFILLLLTSTQAHEGPHDLSITLGQQQIMDDGSLAFYLSTTGATGNITYSVEGLPNGAKV